LVSEDISAHFIRFQYWK